MSDIHILQSVQVQEFIQKHISADIKKLLLNPPKDLQEDIRFIAGQILARQKIKKKLPDWYVNPRLILPPPLSTEQSSSQPTADYKAGLISGERLVDLTGGMGIDTLRLSEEFSTTRYVEQDQWLCQIFKHNARQLTSRSIEVHCSKAEEFLSSFKEIATFFIDPARRNSHQKKVFHFENCTPNVLEMLPHFQKYAEKVLVKAAPMIDISLGIKQLQFVSEVHVVNLRNEVKEVLFVLDFDNIKTPNIHCVNLESNQPKFTFTFEEEKSLSVDYGNPQKYLYDPNASILKSGAFKSIADHYGLDKIAANTHLYTSEEFIENFPGRVFEVMFYEVNKKKLKELLPEGKANVITKNYPTSAETLKDKLGLKDGGNWFVIAFRDESGKPKINVSKQLL